MLKVKPIFTLILIIILELQIKMYKYSEAIFAEWLIMIIKIINNETYLTDTGKKQLAIKVKKRIRS